MMDKQLYLQYISNTQHQHTMIVLIFQQKSMSLAILFYFLLQLGFGLIISLKNIGLLHLILYIISLGFSVQFYVLVYSKNPGQPNKNPTEQPQCLSNFQQMLNQQPKSIDNVPTNPQNNIESQTEQFKQFSKMQNYCRICQIRQPIRTRHCFDCDKCVCTFDHHCPWMNNCIGQKNRHYFITYLILQTIQILFAICTVYSTPQLGQIEKEQLNNRDIIILLFLLVCLLIVTGLLLFHTYLMVTNLTTWEFLKWDKIRYLKDSYQFHGSPFSKGIIKNIRQYWQVSISNKNKQWECQNVLNNKIEQVIGNK